jgi:hypothetical protein
MQGFYIIMPSISKCSPRHRTENSSLLENFTYTRANRYC